MNGLPRTKPIIGIVGGIAAGKSTTAAEFARLGCALIDADAIAHEMLEDPDVRETLRVRWGDAIFTSDGTVDRGKVGEIVFGDPGELAELCAILHPLIRIHMEREVERALRDANVVGVVVDAAVLFEGGWDDLCTHTVFVVARAPQRVERAMKGKGWDEQMLTGREKSQISLDNKVHKCDYTIDNSSSASHLHEQVRKLFHTIIHGADPPRVS